MLKIIDNCSDVIAEINASVRVNKKVNSIEDSVCAYNESADFTVGLINVHVGVMDKNENVRVFHKIHNISGDTVTNYYEVKKKEEKINA